MALNSNRIIIIAGSYGAHQPAKLLLTNLKPSLPVAIVVAFHLAGSLMPRLAEVNGYRSAFVKDGEVIKPGYIYIAPPDHHLFIDKTIFRLTKGPRVNLVRPAFDLIFRSAAVNWGVQVIGVLLSGLLDDGTAGLKAIKACGGMAIVQDPEDAECPEMPQNAIRYGAIDHIAAASEIGAILSEIAMQPVPPPIPIPKALALEHAFDSQTEDTSNLDDIGRPASIVCPECNGPLWELEGSRPPRYRCHIGHSMTSRILMDSQNKEMEKVLWMAYRTLEEKTRLLERLADSEKINGKINKSKNFGSLFQEKASESRSNAEKLRLFLFELAEAEQKMSMNLNDA